MRGVTLSHEATRQRFFRNYAKCGPYDEEPGCSAVKVGPEESGKWGCRATRLVGEGCQNGIPLTGIWVSFISRRSRGGTYEREVEKRGRPYMVLMFPRGREDIRQEPKFFSKPCRESGRS